MINATPQVDPGFPSLTRVEQAAECLPGTVILGGSVARGDTHPKSDLNLFCITDYDGRARWEPRGARDSRLEGKMRKRLGFYKVEVRRATWTEWLSRTKVPATIESTFQREGVLVKWMPPGPWVPWGATTLPTALRRWSKHRPVHLWRPQPTVMTAEDARTDTTRTALAEAKNSTIRIFRRGVNFNRDSEKLGLLEGNPDRFWKEWTSRMLAVNEECHWLMRLAFELTCLSSNVPFRSGWRLMENLDEYPPAARKALGLVDTVDAEWLRNWHRLAYRSAVNPPSLTETEGWGKGVLIQVDPGKYTRFSGTPFDEGVATYAPLAIRVFKDALRWSSEKDPAVYERLANWDQPLCSAESLLEKMESEWVYACGNPPGDWPRPWDVNHPRNTTSRYRSAA